MKDLAALDASLRALFAPFAARLDATRDDADELYLDTRHRQTNGKPLFFGAVQRKAAAVHVHLMPLYLEPGLLVSVPPALRKRLHGKSCFRFASLDGAERDALAALVRAGFASYERQGFV